MTTDWQQAALAENFVITTSRLLIRPLTAQDQQLYLDLYTDPATMRFISPAFATEKALESFRFAIRLNQKTPFKRLFLSITEQDEAAGICAISQWSATSASVELGLMLKQPWHAKGYAVESFLALIQRVKQCFSGAKIWVDIEPGNKAAVKVVVKTGFSPDPDNPRAFWLQQ
jgi:RimJ/RimL family protein N-acetyltransferase